MALFITYAIWSAFRLHAPTTLGPLPVGVVWFGATGAVIASLRGIFLHSKEWKASFNYWYYSRPLYGATTGSIGALMYWVLLRLGNTGAVTVDRATFCVAAFVFGFADQAFMEMLKNVTDVIIESGQKASSSS